MRDGALPILKSLFIQMHDAIKQRFVPKAADALNENPPLLYYVKNLKCYDFQVTGPILLILFEYLE